jgi:hypothetical protein
MNHPVFSIRAEWDDEARVWIATSEDVPGLCAEAGSVEELTAVVLELVPELLVANGVIPAGDPPRDIPVRLTAERRAVAHHAAAA